MTVDVVDLRGFYAEPVGQASRALLNQAIARHFSNLRGMTVLGLGYCTPYLGLFREDAYRSLAFMPARQGVIHWPTARPGKSALVEEDLLPLADASVDRMLIIHALEMARDPHAMLDEAWRVLAAGGRLLMVVPNRRGLWAQRDSTPFGQGRPYSRAQLATLLRDVSFTPVAWSEALWLPPTRWPALLRRARWVERAGSACRLPFAGLHLVEAAKQVYQPMPAKRASRFATQWQPAMAMPSPARTGESLT